MKVADLIRVLLELDQQCLTARPSAWGTAAELVHVLAEHAEPSLRPGPGPDIFGDWASIDLSGVKRPAPRTLDQPVLDSIQRAEAVARDSARLDWLERNTHVSTEVRNLAAAELGADVVDGDDEDEMEEGEECRLPMTLREMIDGLMGAERKGNPEP